MLEKQLQNLESQQSKYDPALKSFAKIKFRDEQSQAIARTFAYWQQHHGQGQRFLWNAKPRFGKTLTSYGFAHQINARRILIITNRPTISDGWAKDFFRFFEKSPEYIFATTKGGAITVNKRSRHIFSRHEIACDESLLKHPLVFFISLQDIKGKNLDTQTFKSKNQWIFDLKKRWDLVIVDEGHEGVKTDKAHQVLTSLPADFTLYLSGTPFRALADRDFSAAQIYNWTYLDEQKAKCHFAAQNSSSSPHQITSQKIPTSIVTLKNPYIAMPRLNFLTYSLAQIFHHQPTPEPCYNLSDFFKVSNQRFVHEELIIQWLDFLAQIFMRNSAVPQDILMQSSIPPSNPSSRVAKNGADCNLRLQVAPGDFFHSLWLFSGAPECLAMQQLLSRHQYFSQYSIILATGKDSLTKIKHLDQVRAAISEAPLQTKTITLSCGQLTTGVTVPEWSAVLMLYNTNDLTRVSATQYLQAAFRTQTPWRINGIYQQECYVLDFLPERAMRILQKYAQDLCSNSSIGQLHRSMQHSQKLHHSVAELLLHLNVFVWQNQQIRKLNALEVINLPRQIIASEIVDGGFIASNKLFNVGSIFRMSPQAQQIISKLSSIHKGRIEKTPRPLAVPITQLDEQGNTIPNLEIIQNSFNEVLKNKKFAKLNRSEKQKINNLALVQLSKIGIKDEKPILKNYPKINQELINEALYEIQLLAQKTARKHRRREENDYRDKLRGFARTIPALLHLYGRPHDTLDSLVASIPNSEFELLANINKTEYAVLKKENYFNETNCNLAIQEFMQREQDLSHYYLSTQSIFDFIPTQQNQRVFTPRHIAEKMADALAEQNPQLFISPQTKFLDPSSKSGILLTAIIKKLYQNLRSQFSNCHDCLLHILSQQIYAWSPDPIAWCMTQRTLFNFMTDSEHNFSNSEIKLCAQNILEYNPILEKGGVKFDAVWQTIQNWQGDMKFDVVISNPPYQYGRRQIYADFYRLAVELNPELLCMIFPIGWQKTNNHNGLGQLNQVCYKRDPHIVSIDNYYENDNRKIFPDIGTGGVNIILRDTNYNNDGTIHKLEYGEPAGKMILPIDSTEIIKPPELINLIEPLQYYPKMDSLGTARKPYGFYADPLRQPEKYQLKLYDRPSQAHDVRLFGLITNDDRGYKYIQRATLPKVSSNLDCYKLFVPKAWGNMSNKNGLGGSYANICVASPGDACTETFIEFGPFASQQEAIKMAKYFMTKFFRALLFLAKDSQNTAKDKYRYIPVPDLSLEIWQNNIPALDDALFKLYNIPQNSRDFIIKNLQARSELNIEIL